MTDNFATLLGVSGQPQAVRLNSIFPLSWVISGQPQYLDLSSH